MRKMYSLWRTLPRKVRVCTNLIVIFLILFLFYLARGSPVFNTMQAFRRAEKIHMVGPSKVVDTLGWKETTMFETLIVGETDYGVVFYGEYLTYTADSWYREEVAEPMFYYREKTGDLTVLGSPVFIFGASLFGDEGQLPLYLFDDYPEAVRAELEMTVSGICQVYTNGETKYSDFTQTFFLNSELRGDGFFRFRLHADDCMNTDTGAAALDFVSHVSSGNFRYYSLTESEETAQIPVTVRLYNSFNQLIVEKNLILQSPAAQAHEEKTDP